MKRTLRHPIRGDRLHPKPSNRPARRTSWRADARQPRMRPRKSVNVASIVGSPEEEDSRPNLRLRVVGVVVLVLFGVLVLRLWTLQVIDGKTYAAAVTRNQVRVVSIAAPARRDRRPQRHRPGVEHPAAGDPAVAGRGGTEPGASSGWWPRWSVRRPKQVQTAVNNVQYSPYEPVPVASGVSVSTVQYLQTHQAEYPGVSVQTVTQRTYPQGGRPATHVLGYVGQITSSFLAANPTRATPRAARSAWPASKGSTSPTCAGWTGARPSRWTPAATWWARSARRPPRSATPWCSTSTPISSRRSSPTSQNQIQIDRTHARHRRQPLPAGAQRRRRGDGPPERPGPGPGLLPELRPERMGRRHLLGQLRRPLSQRGRERQCHRGPLHAGVDLQARDGHRRPAGRASSARPRPTWTPGTFKIPGCPAPGVNDDTGCTLNDDPGDSGGTYNVSTALDGVERLVLLQPRRHVLGRPGAVRRHAHSERGDGSTARAPSPASTCRARRRAGWTAT